MKRLRPLAGVLEDLRELLVEDHRLGLLALGHVGRAAARENAVLRNSAFAPSFEHAT